MEALSRANTTVSRQFTVPPTDAKAGSILRVLEDGRRGQSGLFQYAPWHKNLIAETTLEPGTRRVLNRFAPIFAALFLAYSKRLINKGRGTIQQLRAHGSDGSPHGSKSLTEAHLTDRIISMIVFLELVHNVGLVPDLLGRHIAEAEWNICCKSLPGLSREGLTEALLRMVATYMIVYGNEVQSVADGEWKAMYLLALIRRADTHGWLKCDLEEAWAECAERPCDDISPPFISTPANVYEDAPRPSSPASVPQSGIVSRIQSKDVAQTDLSGGQDSLFKQLTRDS